MYTNRLKFGQLRKFVPGEGTALNSLVQFDATLRPSRWIMFSVNFEIYVLLYLVPTTCTPRWNFYWKSHADPLIIYGDNLCLKWFHFCSFPLCINEVDIFTLFMSQVSKIVTFFFVQLIHKNTVIIC